MRAPIGTQVYPCIRWAARTCAAAALLLLLMAQAPALAEPRRVLLLHSFGPYFEPWSAVAARFREDLTRRLPAVDLYEASLEMARLPQPAEEAPLVDYIRALFAGRDLDLVVAVGAPAARFLQKYRPQFSPPAPLLIVAADQRAFSEGALTSNDATVPSTLDLPKLVENILQVLPDTNNIAFVIGASRTRAILGGRNASGVPALRREVDVRVVQWFVAGRNGKARRHPATALGHLLCKRARRCGWNTQRAKPSVGETSGSRKRAHIQLPRQQLRSRYRRRPDDLHTGPRAQSRGGRSPHPEGRTSGQYPDIACGARSTSLRLAGTSTLEHQRSSSAAGQHRAIQRAFSVGTLPLAGDGDICSPVTPVGDHHLAADSATWTSQGRERIP